MSRRATTIALAIVLVAAGWVGATPVGADSRSVSSEAEFRAALAELSAEGGTSHVLHLDADFTITGAGDPTYTGPSP